MLIRTVQTLNANDQRCDSLSVRREVQSLTISLTVFVSVFCMPKDFCLNLIFVSTCAPYLNQSQNVSFLLKSLVLFVPFPTVTLGWKPWILSIWFGSNKEKLHCFYLDCHSVLIVSKKSQSWSCFHKARVYSFCYTVYHNLTHTLVPSPALSTGLAIIVIWKSLVYLQ